MPVPAVHHKSPFSCQVLVSEKSPRLQRDKVSSDNVSPAPSTDKPKQLVLRRKKGRVDLELTGNLPAVLYSKTSTSVLSESSLASYRRLFILFPVDYNEAERYPRQSISSSDYHYSASLICISVHFPLKCRLLRDRSLFCSVRSCGPSRVA